MYIICKVNFFISELSHKSIIPLENRGEMEHRWKGRRRVNITPSSFFSFFLIDCSAKPLNKPSNNNFVIYYCTINIYNLRALVVGKLGSYIAHSTIVPW